MQMTTACLTVGLLETCAGAWATKLLGLASPGVCHQKSPVVHHKDVLDLLFGLLVNVCSRHRLC